MAESNTTLHAAYERLSTVSSDEKLRILALNREKAIRDWNSSIHYAEQHGKEQINKLNQCLLTDNRFDDLKRSISDPDFQKQLLIFLFKRGTNITSPLPPYFPGS